MKTLIPALFTMVTTGRDLQCPSGCTGEVKNAPSVKRYVT